MSKVHKFSQLAPTLSHLLYVKEKHLYYEAQRRVTRIALSKERATRLVGIHTVNAVRMISKVEKYNLEQVKQLSSA